MERKLIWAAMAMTLAGICVWCACLPAPMGVAGGYLGWWNEGTGGHDAKITSELNIQSSNPLLNGLWMNYVNYNNTNNGQKVKSLSTYVEHSAPAGVFTVDGARRQHFSQHVGTLVASAVDKNGDGIICWIGCHLEQGSPGGGDYALQSAFCPSVGGTAGTGSSGGFTADCSRAVWVWLNAANFAEETKTSASSGLLFSTSAYQIVFNPITLGRIVASSTVLPNNVGFAPNINVISLPNGDSHTLASPITISVYSGGSAISVNADQPGLKELASWLASEWINQADGESPITATFNGGVADESISVASGHTVAVALQTYASW